MSHKDVLQDSLADLDALQAVTGALAERSVRKIADVRAVFERSVPFYRSVEELYALVRVRAEREGVAVRHARPRAGTVAIALTSNHRFHGELNRAVATTLFEHIPSGGSAFMIGRTGAALLKSFGFERRVRSLVFENDMPTARELEGLIERIAAFERVVLYHPAFINLAVQRVEETEIGATARAGKNDGRAAGRPPLGGARRGTLDARETLPSAGSSSEPADEAYIFEPELVELALFFETEVRRYLFARVFFEAELARTAARLFAMSTAERTIARERRAVRLALRRIAASAETMRTLEIFAGVREWRREQLPV